MKKYIVLAISTIVFISIFSISGQLIINDVKYVSLEKVTPTTVEDVVVSSGTIEYKVNKKLYSSNLGTLENLYVSNGDNVKKGDLIGEVIVSSNLPISSLDEENALANGDLSQLEDYNTQDVYQQILSGNYDILNDYDKYLENSDAEYNQYVTQVNNQENIDESVKLYANASGVVSDLNYGVGDFVELSKEICTIISDDDFNVKLEIGEDKISKIEVGQPVEISNVVVGEEVLKGTVSKVDNEAEQKTTATGKDTTVEVTVSIDESNKMLKSGYSAKCSIITSSKDDVYLIPYEVINVNDEGEEFVYVYEDGIANAKMIDTTNEYAQGVEVSDDFNTDDYIINCSTTLSDGEFVKVADESKVK